MTSGPMEFREPMSSRGGPSKWHWEVKDPSKSHVKAGKIVKISEKTFLFFWDHLIFTGKTVEIPVKTLFFSFGDHISFQIKQQHFLRLFWISHYENSVMLELAPGPHLTLGAPGARATQLLLNNCHNGGEPLATLCLIWSAGDLNRRPPAPETNVLPLDQLVGLDCLS